TRSIGPLRKENRTRRRKAQPSRERSCGKSVFSIEHPGGVYHPDASRHCLPQVGSVERNLSGEAIQDNTVRAAVGSVRSAELQVLGDWRAGPRIDRLDQRGRERPLAPNDEPYLL